MELNDVKSSFFLTVQKWSQMSQKWTLTYCSNVNIFIARDHNVKPSSQGHAYIARRLNHNTQIMLSHPLFNILQLIHFHWKATWGWAGVRLDCSFFNPFLLPLLQAANLADRSEKCRMRLNTPNNNHLGAVFRTYGPTTPFGVPTHFYTLQPIIDLHTMSC